MANAVAANWNKGKQEDADASTTLFLHSALKRHAGVRDWLQDVQSAKKQREDTTETLMAKHWYTTCPSCVIAVFRGPTDPPELTAT